MKKDYKAGETVQIKSLPEHLKNRADLIGKYGTVKLNNPYADELPLIVLIGGTEWNHEYQFEYENIDESKLRLT